MGSSGKKYRRSVGVKVSKGFTPVIRGKQIQTRPPFFLKDHRRFLSLHRWLAGNRDDRWEAWAFGGWAVEASWSAAFGGFRETAVSCELCPVRITGHHGKEAGAPAARGWLARWQASHTLAAL